MKYILFIFFFCSCSFANPSSFTDISPVANITKDQTTIQRIQVIWMYTMKVRYWYDGTRIILFNLPSNSRTHKNFVRNVLNMSPISYQQSVDRLKNSGYASYFRTVRNEMDMVGRISSTAGAIGYLTDNMLIIYDGGSFRAIKIVD
jgi:ABC-type phosphate transport system substrate-binding protein